MVGVHARELREVRARLSRRRAQERRSLDWALRLDGHGRRIRGAGAGDTQRMVRARRSARRSRADLRVRARLHAGSRCLGQGYATEAARCVRDYARDVLGWSYAVSAILPQNARSRRVAERSGARADGHMHVVGLTWDRWVWPFHDTRTGH